METNNINRRKKELTNRSQFISRRMKNKEGGNLVCVWGPVSERRNWVLPSRNWMNFKELKSIEKAWSDALRGAGRVRLVSICEEDAIRLKKRKHKCVLRGPCGWFYLSKFKIGKGSPHLWTIKVVPWRAFTGIRHSIKGIMRQFIEIETINWFIDCGAATLTDSFNHLVAIINS